MSAWDAYIDNLLSNSADRMGGLHADKACIIGLDGGAKWTTDDHACAIHITTAEALAIANVLRSKDFSSFQSGGIHLEGLKYQFLREEDGKTAMGKKKDHGSVTLQASKKAVVIGHCPEGKQQGNLNKAVSLIADYLESVGM